MDYHVLDALLQFLVVLLVGIYSLWRVFVYKNKHNRNVSTVTEFTPPPGIDPVMCGILKDGRPNSEDITAGIITLAQMGVVSIVPVEDEKTLDYEITYNKALGGYDDSHYDNLLRLIFVNPILGESVLLSSITKNKKIKVRNFYIFRQLKNDLYAKLVGMGYIEELSVDDMFKGAIKRLFISLVILFLLATISMTLSIFVGYSSPQINVSMLAVMTLLTIPFIDMLLRWRRLTEEGALIRSQLDGFYKYLALAEHDRYKSEKSLDSNVLSWCEFLPYAVAFGLVTKWNDAFASIRSLQDETGRF